MPFVFTPTQLPGCIHIAPRTYGDMRGFFLETYKYSEFAAHGIDMPFVQDNHSRSVAGVVRGLHFQRAPKAQGKLVRVVVGEIFDVAVDIRPDSDAFGKWVGYRLSAVNKHMLYMPPGFAHGFCVLSDVAEVQYKTTQEYDPALESGIRFDDPQLGINWPVVDPHLSDKDRNLPSLSQLT